MKTITSATLVAGILLVAATNVSAQQTRAFNQNSSRSNHTRSLSLSFSPVMNTPLQKSNDSVLFRGTGAGFKFGADYFFNAVGLGIVTGFSSTKADDALISSFISRSGFPPDQLVITKAPQQNMYLLLGPSVKLGNAVQFYAQAKGGLFINNGGLVNIQQKGAVRSLYRNEAGTKSIYPGFMTGAGVQYSNKNDTWSIGFGADYLNTKTQLNNIDARRANGIEALSFSRTVSDLMAGLSFRYNIRSARDAASGQATGRRSVVTSREAGSGMATGRRSVVTTREAGSGMATGRRMRSVTTNQGDGMPATEEITETIIMDEPGSNCGMVTQRTTTPDGTVEEMTFACPADAAAYQRSINSINGGMPNRISMNVTVPKQTQGATFGEKVNQGLQTGAGNNAAKQTQGATFGEKVNQGLQQGTGQKREGIVHRDIAARNLIYGSVKLLSPASTGIVTNKPAVSTLAGGGSGAAAASYAATGLMADGGSVLHLYSREAGSGQATGRRSREKGSGLATGRRQYQPLLMQGGGCDNCGGTVKVSQVNNNPLYKEEGNEGSNPLYGSKAGGPYNDCDGIAGLDVVLTDPRSGAVIASTKTGSCGEYFFANVPEAVYAVKLSGSFASSKTYEATLTTASDLQAQLLTGNAAIEVSAQVIEADTELTSQSAAALIKTKTKSNQSNDRTAAENNEEEIWSPRSNVFRIATIGTGDLDGDGVPEIVAGGSQQRPGNPIGGISIKGGKNPGGNIGSRTTDASGIVEFTDLDAGTYTFTVEQQLLIREVLVVEAGNRAQDHNSSRSNKTGNKSAVQDHNSSRSNKSSSGIEQDPDMGGQGKLVASKGDVKLTASQNSQSLRTISVQADMDGDGVYETDITTKVTDEIIMDKDGNLNEPQQKAGVSTSRSNIRNRSALQPVTQTVFTGYGTTIINGKEVPVKSVYKVVEKATSGLKDTLKTQV